MGLNDRFNKTSTTSRGKSRYEGIDPSGGSSGPQEPAYGTYLLDINEASYGRSRKNQQEYYAATMTVVESEGQGADAPGTEVRFGQGVNQIGVQIILAFLMAAQGFSDAEEFRAWCDKKTDEEIENVAGKRVIAKCARGRQKPESGYYTEWDFAPAE